MFGRARDGGSAAAVGAGAAAAAGDYEPRWIAEAAKAKPRLDEPLLSTKPQWHPRERPHVRPHSESDLPLRTNPYVKRR